jgi:hypothetical protein
VEIAQTPFTAARPRRRFTALPFSRSFAATIDASKLPPDRATVNTVDHQSGQAADGDPGKPSGRSPNG